MDFFIDERPAKGAVGIKIVGDPRRGEFTWTLDPAKKSAYLSQYRKKAAALG